MFFFQNWGILQTSEICLVVDEIVWRSQGSFAGFCSIDTREPPKYELCPARDRKWLSKIMFLVVLLFSSRLLGYRIGILEADWVTAVERTYQTLETTSLGYDTSKSGTAKSGFDGVPKSRESLLVFSVFQWSCKAAGVDDSHLRLHTKMYHLLGVGPRKWYWAWSLCWGLPCIDTSAGPFGPGARHRRVCLRWWITSQGFHGDPEVQTLTLKDAKRSKSMGWTSHQSLITN